jgi:hypothetical protein
MPLRMVVASFDPRETGSLHGRRVTQAMPFVLSAIARRATAEAFLSAIALAKAVAK